jgi:threonylcarbamoyladenosine tRNA methylthiotransferase MtaB
MKRKSGFLKSLLENKSSVLVEQNREVSTGMLKGMSSNYISVLLDGPDDLKNSIQTVTITRVSENLMVYGRIEYKV